MIRFFSNIIFPISIILFMLIYSSMNIINMLKPPINSLSSVTESPTHLVYHDRLMQSACEQQDYPLMASLFCLTRYHIYEEIYQTIWDRQIYFDPEFVDDGLHIIKNVDI